MVLQLTSLDILYLSLALGFLVLVTALVVLISNAIKTLRSIKLLVDEVEETVTEANRIKERVKMGVGGLISGLIGLFTKR